MTCGYSHIKFFKLQGSNLKGDKGSTGDEFSPMFCSTYAFNNTVCITGDAAGNLRVWKGKSCSKPVTSH